MNLNALETGFDLAAPRGDELMDEFYSRLFAAAPAVKSLSPGDLRPQKAMLLAALVLVRKLLSDLDAIAPTLRGLGARHVAYGARPEHYPLVGSVLIAAMATIAGDAWTAEYERAWSDAFVAATMLEGPSRPRSTPPSMPRRRSRHPREATAAPDRPTSPGTRKQKGAANARASHTHRASAAARRGCPHT